MNDAFTNNSNMVFIKEYESYQFLAEQMMQDMNKKITILEKKMDNYATLMEIIKYINSHIQNKDILFIINDILLGLIGSNYSSIYENNKKYGTILKVTNSPKLSNYERNLLIKTNEFKSFILNKEEDIFSNEKKYVPIHSILGCPIILNDKLLGYIILEHTNFNYFNSEQLMFISAIANQIAILLENNRLYREIQKIANKDILTNMYNRRYFFNKMESIVEKTPKQSFGIIMIDIDDFKKINDIYGHQFGDEVLKTISNIIINHIGKNGICARYGGEEIIIYLNNIEYKTNAYNFLDELRKKIKNTIVNFNNMTGNVTVSMGFSIHQSCTDTLNSVIKCADELLYKAKKSGKNKLIMQNI